MISAGPILQESLCWIDVMEPERSEGFPANLFDLAFVGGFDEGFPELAKLAEAEDWGYRKNSADRPNPILLSYVRYTYQRLVEEDKLVLDKMGQRLCFNTGLITDHQQDIFALFVPNRRENAAPWFLSGWYPRSAGELRVFSKLPDIAQYYDDPSALVFDARLEFRVAVEHIIEENRERFPEPFRLMESFALQNLFNGAIDAAKVRVRRNYKTAIPQYYRNRPQLLLPICLSHPKVADLALVIEKYEGYYLAATCLTLDMAYNNARLIARPDKDWLQP